MFQSVYYNTIDIIVLGIIGLILIYFISSIVVYTD